MPKVAVVGVVGRTNAGKSTLVNALVGEKVSIVSPVERTTRNTIRGIVSDPRGQIVLLDTPGLHKAVGDLGRLMNRMARRSAAGTDVTCVVFDASDEPRLEDIGWMQRVAKEKPEKVLFVLNKADKAPFYETMFRDAWVEAQNTVAENSDKEDKTPPCEPVWVKSISTTEGGANRVLDALFDFALEGELLFDEDTVTDYPRRLAIADCIREKFLARIHQEIPHELGVLIKSIDEKTSGGKEVWNIKVDVLVNRSSQKPIVIGRGAQTIKFVRKGAERDVSEMFGVKASIEVWVRVEPGWMKNPRILSDMGYMGDLV